MANPDSKITFNNVKRWLVQKGFPADEAERLCRSDLRNGLRCLNKMKAYDKKLAQLKSGQTSFKWR